MTDQFSAAFANPEKRVPDSDYLASLEKRLKSIKDKKKITSKSVLEDIQSLKNDQLFKFLTSDQEKTSEELKFEDDFVKIDKNIEPNLLRKKIAPQTCAINKSEIASIVKYDLTQKLHEFYSQLDETAEDRLESHQLLQELQELSKELENDSLSIETQNQTDGENDKEESKDE